jgi:TrmH family RNA methyltransferase
MMIRLYHQAEGMYTSSTNPKIKLIRALRQRKQRDATGLFVVEGIRHVGEVAEASGATETSKAADAGWLEYLCYCPELLTSDFARELIRKQEKHGLPCYAVTAATFITLADKENPQGILAVARQRHRELDELHPGCLPWGVALVAPQDPGNIGAVLRTIDAVGASGLLLLNASVDPYHPGAVRASMGALFWYPVISATFAKFADWAKRNGYHIYGTSARGSQQACQVNIYYRPAILLMGSEREGLTEEQRAVCETLIRLPMKGRVTSLNLAVATGVMLYEMLGKLEG